MFDISRGFVPLQGVTENHSSSSQDKPCPTPSSLPQQAPPQSSKHASNSRSGIAGDSAFLSDQRSGGGAGGERLAISRDIASVSKSFVMPSSRETTALHGSLGAPVSFPQAFFSLTYSNDGGTIADFTKKSKFSGAKSLRYQSFFFHVLLCVVVVFCPLSHTCRSRHSHWEGDMA